MIRVMSLASSLGLIKIKCFIFLILLFNTKLIGNHELFILKLLN